MKKILVGVMLLGCVSMYAKETGHLDNELSWYEANWFEAAGQGNMALLEQIVAEKDKKDGIQDVNIQQIGTRKTALHVAAENGQLAAVQWLIAKGVSPRIVNADGDTLLHTLASADIEDVPETTLASITSYLVGKTDANVNALNRNQNSPLFVAVGNDRGLIVDALLSSKTIDLTFKSPDGLTPRDMAVLMGNMVLAQRLEKAGINVDPKMDARVKWFYAISNGDLAGVQKGLTEGQSLDQSIEELYPLHLATSEGKHAIMQELISRGADVNKKGASGNTPLHEAVQNEDHKAVKLLLDNGAKESVNVKNDENETPQSLALEIEDQKTQNDIFDLLRGVKIPKPELPKVSMPKGSRGL